MKSVKEGSLERAGGREHGGRNVADLLLRYYIQVLLVIAVVILSIVNPNFRRLSNYSNILLQSSFAGIGAAGMTLLIIAGAFDLSVAGILGVCGIALALLSPVSPALLAVLATLLIGVALGLVNGFVVTRMKIPAFIATLGMMNVYLGVAFIATQGQVLGIGSRLLRSLGTDAVFGILPIPFLVMIVVYVLCSLFLGRTIYGRYLRAIGSSETASRTMGIPVNWIKVVCFAIVGVCTAIAGVLLAGELSSANAIMASGYELNAIAIVVVGGTSLKGGSGTLFGSFTGALFFAVINNALNIFGVGAYWQYVISGLLLISAVGIEVIRGYVRGAD
jgi:ribose/xylose/arabinose/galactoside ABC-type transport system permease subunit